MKHEKWAKYFTTCNTIEYSSELKKLHSLTSALWLITLMWNDFFLDAVTNPKEREILNEPVSIKVGVQFKTSFMQLVS